MINNSNNKNKLGYDKIKQEKTKSREIKIEKS